VAEFARKEEHQFHIIQSWEHMSHGPSPFTAPHVSSNTVHRATDYCPC